MWRNTVPLLWKRSVIHNFCIANQNNLLEQSGKKTHTHTLYVCHGVHLKEYCSKLSLFFSLSDIFSYEWNVTTMFFSPSLPCLACNCGALIIQRICWNGNQHWLPCTYQDKRNITSHKFHFNVKFVRHVIFMMSKNYFYVSFIMQACYISVGL